MSAIKGGVRRRTELIQEAYFEWMIRLVCVGRYGKRQSWRKLFHLLHGTEFIYILEMDANRADDGTDLRYRFAYECGYDGDEIRACLDDRPCSMLEMMTALALRCEEYVADDSEDGDGIGKWFFGMLRSLGLGDMSDSMFDEIAAMDILTRFMRRQYLPNGQGGLFTVVGAGHDMRTAEIWYQMMWYLTETIYGRR